MPKAKEIAAAIIPLAGLILLVIGMLSGAWMISGVVPTIIVYGVRIVRPEFFLVTATVVCAIVALVHWNACAMAQAASLRVATVDYLPYCFFNLLSPLVTLCVAAVGHGIVRVRKGQSPMTGSEVCGG